MGRRGVDKEGAPFLQIRLQRWCTDNHYRDIGRPMPGVTSGRVPAFLIPNFTRPEPSPDASQIHPAWKLRIFFIYPLGIMSGRPYDGGLSFSAKMRIEAEGGV